MKIVNGKLLGQPKSELDIFKQAQDRHNLSVQTSLQEVAQRIDEAENMLQEESLSRQVANYVRHLEERCNYLEREQKKLRRVQQPVNHKLLWLTFAGSIVLGIMSFSIWLDINSVRKSLPQVELRSDRPQLTKSNHF